ncbi:hypothetical protein J6590_095491 [Homalodisca vitripennis]|nr:hypothetical protein J6590_095491 [Homalodisca vitripennis]
MGIQQAASTELPKEHSPVSMCKQEGCRTVNCCYESLSVSEEIGRMATSYMPSDWRLFTYISISKGSGSILELNFFIIWRN